jgi:hypothetical protein
MISFRQRRIEDNGKITFPLVNPPDIGLTEPPSNLSLTVDSVHRLRPDRLPEPKRRAFAMNVTFISRPSGHRYRNADLSGAVDFPPSDSCGEIDEAAKRLKLEEAVRKATAQLRQSVKLPNPLDDALYSPISGRRVAPSAGRLLAGRISRSHQRR